MIEGFSLLAPTSCFVKFWRCCCSGARVVNKTGEIPHAMEAVEGGKFLAPMRKREGQPPHPLVSGPWADEFRVDDVIEKFMRTSLCYRDD